MNFKSPGLSARITTSTYTAVAKRDNATFTTDVPHLKGVDSFTTQISGVQASVKEKLPWKEFSEYATPLLKAGTPINIYLVTWDNCAKQDVYPYASPGFDNKEIVMVAGLTGLDEFTKTFTVTNELNQLGQGVSGGLAYLEIEKSYFEIGQINSIADGGYSNQLRCVTTDSVNLDKFYNDILTAHKKLGNGNTSERHQNGIENVKTNFASAEKKATKCRAGKNALKQREIKEARKQQSLESTQKKKANKHKNKT